MKEKYPVSNRILLVSNNCSYTDEKRREVNYLEQLKEKNPNNEVIIIDGGERVIEDSKFFGEDSGEKRTLPALVLSGVSNNYFGKYRVNGFDGRVVDLAKKYDVPLVFIRVPGSQEARTRDMESIRKDVESYGFSI